MLTISSSVFFNLWSQYSCLTLTSPLLVSFNFVWSQRTTSWRTICSEIFWHFNPKSSGAEGSGLRRWPLAIMACGSHTGASVAWLSGSTTRHIPTQSPPKAFPPQTIAYFCLPDERSQRARRLKGALGELSQKPSYLTSAEMITL